MRRRVKDEGSNERRIELTEAFVTYSELSLASRTTITSNVDA